MKILKRIYHLLHAEERKKVLKMAITVFLSCASFIALPVDSEMT